MTDRKVKKAWSQKPQGTKGLKPISTLMKEKRAPSLKVTAMTMEEKVIALELYHELGNVDAIATKMQRSPEILRKFLWRYQSTTKAAKLRLEGGAEILADRIIKDANVEESLEVMDRLGILEKKRDKQVPQTSFSLIIGMPNNTANPIHSVPVPSQKQINDAIDAQVVEVKP